MNIVSCIILISSAFSVQSRRLKRYDDDFDDNKIEQEAMASVAQDIFLAQVELNKTEAEKNKLKEDIAEHTLSTLISENDTIVHNNETSTVSNEPSSMPPSTSSSSIASPIEQTTVLVTTTYHNYHDDTTSPHNNVETVECSSSTLEDADTTWDSNWRDPEKVTQRLIQLDEDADRQRELADMQREEADRIREDADRQRDDAEKIREKYNI